MLMLFVDDDDDDDDDDDGDDDDDDCSHPWPRPVRCRSRIVLRVRRFRCRSPTYHRVQSEARCVDSSPRQSPETPQVDPSNTRTTASTAGHYTSEGFFIRTSGLSYVHVKSTQVDIGQLFTN